MSRTAWVAAIAGCSFAGAGYHFRGRRSRDLRAWARRHKKRIAWLGITTIVAGSLALAGAYHLKRDSADGRVLTWKMAARAAWHHPSGVGMGRFAAAYGEEQAAYFAAGKGSERERHVAGNPEYAFNEFLQVAIEMGVIPLLLFAGITVLVIARAVRRRGYPLAGAFVSVQLFACASYPYNLLPFVVALAFLAAGGACGESSRGRGRGRAGWWVVPLLLAGVTGACLYLAWPQRAAYEAWNDARILGSGKLYEKAIEEYEKLSPVLDHETRFLFEYGQCLSRAGRHEESNRVLERAARGSCDPMIHNITGKNYQAMQRYEEAERCFFRAYHTVPNRLYPLYLLARLYIESGQTARGVEMARRVVATVPKIASPATDEMKREMNEWLARQSI
jgi:tetratricopeptide (TPR) repeat protein